VAQIEAFNDPSRNLFKERAKDIFGHAVSSDSFEYRMAKATFHAANYMEGPKQLSLQTGMKLGLARKLLRDYHRQFPEIARWHQWVLEQLNGDAVLTTPTGQFRFFYTAVGCRIARGTVSKACWREAVAWVPQTTVPMVINRVMMTLDERYPDVHWHVHHHDAFIASVPVEQYVAFCDDTKELCGQQRLEFGDTTLVIPVQIKCGWNWGELVSEDAGLPPRSTTVRSLSVDDMAFMLETTPDELKELWQYAEPHVTR
jgi:DNA polymerase I-like protein with 3'-5' exonuclease and polymerase domains